MAFVKRAGKSKVVSSSGSLDGLTKLISKYYMNSDITVFGSEVFNKKGLIPNVFVELKGNTYYFKRKIG